MSRTRFRKRYAHPNQEFGRVYKCHILGLSCISCKELGEFGLKSLQADCSECCEKIDDDFIKYKVRPNPSNKVKRVSKRYEDPLRNSPIRSDLRINMRANSAIIYLFEARTPLGTN